MRIALIDGTKKHTYYPVGLLRIGAYLKDIGHEVELFYKDLPAQNDIFDEYWISAIFTFEIAHVKKLIRYFSQKGKVRVGGISPTIMPEAFKNEPCELSIGRMTEAEIYPLDYSLLKEKPEYSMAKITDGCIRKCAFCAVPKLEPKYTERPNWKADILETTKFVVLSDNNYTARPLDKMREDAEYFQDLKKTTKNKYIDFNQAIDARLITEEMAEILGKMPINPMRFSYDGSQERGHIQTAIERMAAQGKKTFIIYMLYNFTDTIPYAYQRIKELVLLQERLGVNITVFPMRYQPLDCEDTDRAYVGKHWTIQARKNFMSAINQYSIGGQFSFPSVDEFRYWLGDSAEKFTALMAYPKAKELFSRRKEELRKIHERERGVKSGQTKERD